MSNNTLVKGVVVCCVYAIFSYIEYNFIIKEPMKIKRLVQNIIVVYISYVGGIFIYDQIEPMKTLQPLPTVFTSAPDF